MPIKMNDSQRQLLSSEETSMGLHHHYRLNRPRRVQTDPCVESGEHHNKTGMHDDQTGAMEAGRRSVSELRKTLSHLRKIKPGERAKLGRRG